MIVDLDLHVVVDPDLEDPAVTELVGKAVEPAQGDLRASAVEAMDLHRAVVAERIDLLGVLDQPDLLGKLLKKSDDLFRAHLDSGKRVVAGHEISGIRGQDLVPER